MIVVVILVIVFSSSSCCSCCGGNSSSKSGSGSSARSRTRSSSMHKSNSNLQRLPASIALIPEHEWDRVVFEQVECVAASKVYHHIPLGRWLEEECASAASPGIVF